MAEAATIPDAPPVTVTERRHLMGYDQWLAWAPVSRQTEWVDGEAIEFRPPKTVHALVGLFLTQRLAL